MRGRLTTKYLLLAVLFLPQLSHAISGSYSDYGWSFDSNKKLHKASITYSYSISGLHDVEKILDKTDGWPLKQDKEYEPGAEGYTFHNISYRANILTGETVTVQLNVDLSGDKIITDSLVVGIGFAYLPSTGWLSDYIKPKKRERAIIPAKGGSASLTYSFHIDRLYTATPPECLTLLLSAKPYGEEHNWGMPKYPGSFNIHVVLSIPFIPEQQQASTLESEYENDDSDEESLDDDDEEDDEEYWDEEDSDAWNWGGVWSYVIPIGVIAVLGGAAVAAGKKKKKKDKPATQDGVYTMEVYKDFGNTLSPDGGTYPVYARIVKVVGGADPVPEPALTSMIEITGDAYLQVGGHRMENGWRCADVSAPQQDAVPEEGVMTFALAGDRGGYVNHLHFKIEAGQVLFGQDNLTLPAHHTQEERLPFVVTGMAEGATIEATITEPENKPTDYYNVRVEWNAELDMHEAVITDLKRDLEKDNGTPGDYLPFTLHIVVTNPGGSRMEGWMPVVRFYMGLAFKVDDVKCFMEEYDPAKHKKLTVGVEHGNKKFVPAETTGYLQLYDYDEELHCVLTINPKPTSFNVKVIDERESREVEGIGLKPDLTGCDNPKGTELVLRCMEGVLDAPSRIDAIITIEAEFDGRSYSCAKQVLLCSQPVRTFQTEAEEIAAAKEDEQIREKLLCLQERIELQGLAGPLLPIIKYIDNMLLGYQFRYGFDRSQMRFVAAMYNYMINDMHEYTYRDTPPLSLADDMLTCLQLTFEQYGQPVVDFTHQVYLTFKPVVDAANKLNEYTAVPILIARIAAGFWTYGASEAYFKAYDVASLALAAVNINEVYVNEGVEGLTQSLTVMVKHTAKFQILMTGVNMGLHMGLGGLRAKYNPRVTSKPAPSGQQFSTAKKGRVTRENLRQSAQQQQAAEEFVHSPEMKAKMKAIPDDGSHDAAYNYLSDLSQQQMKDMRGLSDLMQLFERYGETPSKETLAFKRYAIIRAQQNPQFKHMLKHSEGAGWKAVKRMFNEEWYGSKDGTTVGIYNEVDASVKRILARQTGKSASEIHVDAVSGNKMNDLWEGNTTAMDRDVRYYYRDAQGNKVSFNQKYTEELYNGVLYKKTTNCKKLSQQQVNDFAERVDNTVIEDIKNHMESLGPDVENLMSGKLDAPLVDPQRVQKTVVWKSADRYVKAAEWYERAQTMTDPHEKLMAEVRGAMNELEGSYMTGKDGRRFVTALDDARVDINGQKFVSLKLQRAFKICDQVDTAKSINPRELRKQLKVAGYDNYTELVQDIDHTMGQILQHDIKNVQR